MIVIGSNFFPSTGDAGRRQDQARRALLALNGVIPINLQFADADWTPPLIETRHVLRQDSRTATGAEGKRKPIVREMLDALAGIADERGCRYFAYVNADVEVTQDAVDRIEARGRDAYAFCRVDVDARSRAHATVQLYGTDLFAADARWWRRQRRRFRPYIAGEACWDNVYAAIACSHGRAEIVHDAPGIFHERHDADWMAGPFADYNGYLAALDAPYFSRWAVYVSRLRDAAAAGRTADADAIAREVFSGPVLTPAGRVRHAARSVLARLRYARRRKQDRQA